MNDIGSYEWDITFVFFLQLFITGVYRKQV